MNARVEGLTTRRDEDAQEADWRTAEVLWALGSLCEIHRLPFDAALVQQAFPPPHTLASFIDAAARVGLKIRPASMAAQSLGALPTPFIARCRSDVRERAESLALVVRCGPDQIVFFPAGVSEAETVEGEQCLRLFEPTVLLVAPLAIEAHEADEPAQPPFGFRWFVPELLRHRSVWRNIIAASLVLQLVALTTPLFTQVIIDKVIIHHTQSTLFAVATGLVMFVVFGTLLTWLRQYFVLHTGNRIDAVLGSRVVEHLLHLPLPYFEARPAGTVIARLQGVETVREFVSGAAVTLILDVPFVFVFLAVMFTYSWQLSFIAVGMLLLLVTLSLVVTPGLRARIDRQFLLGARNQAFVTEFVGGIETVKSLQMEPYLQRQYGEMFANYLSSSFATRQYSNTTHVIAGLIEQTQTVAILCVGALLVMDNPGFTVGMLVAFQMFASRMAQPLLRLASLWQEFQQASVAVCRLGDLMNAPPERHGLVPSGRCTGLAELKIAGVSFRYRPSDPFIYNNLSLTIAPGQLAVITGPSGAGKSTLVKLAQGFYLPEAGRVEIDGRDIHHLSANELRRHFGVVPQETRLFAGTLYDNLIMASPHASFDDVVEACRMAEIHGHIEKLPEGYQTIIGEHGIGLSGGQKQRLAIARALLKRPRILVFDEATSHLDAATAEQFAQTVNRLKGSVTILFIAHHLPKTLAVDRIYGLGVQPRRPAQGAEAEQRT